MVHLIRKYQQPVMILITIVIIIAFGWFFTPGSGSRHGAPAGTVRIYGHTYLQEELERRSRSYGVAMMAGLHQLVLGLTFGNPYGDQAGSNFVFNSFVLAHEAERLGITVQDDEVAALIEKLPAFQTNGAYDKTKYRTFEENVLRPRGFTLDKLEELARDQLRLQKLVTLVGSTVEVTPGEFRTEYVQNNQKMHASVVRFDIAAFKAAIQPTEEEIVKVYKEREKTYNAPEKRSVSYVQMDLSAAEKALKGKELLDARQALANRANDFSQDLLQENATFAGVAKKYALEIKTAPAFPEAQPPADLAAVPQISEAVFRLTEKEPISDPLPVGNGYIVLHLEKVTPSRPLPFDEARSQVIEDIRSEQGSSALVAKGNAVSTQLAEALKGGKSFAEAAQAAGLKAEELPAFSPTEPLEKVADGQEILTKAVELPNGALSGFSPTPTGGIIVHLDKRDPIDEAEFKKDEQAKLAETRERKSFMAFLQWLDTRRKLANISGGGQ